MNKTSHSFSRKKSAAGHALLGPVQVAAVADLFAVLSEPTRLRILQLLQAGPASVGEMVETLDLKQANASKQLGILLAAGVLRREQQGNRAIYSIAMPLVNDLCGLVCTGLAQHASERAAALAE
ncbi:metalloregulator ArsR/SmtB family transcription factor [soil metagenome]